MRTLKHKEVLRLEGAEQILEGAECIPSKKSAMATPGIQPQAHEEGAKLFRGLSSKLRP
jgi:hypothetical protein